MDEKCNKYTENQSKKTGVARRFLVFVLLLATIMATSCATKLPPIPAEITSAELVQKAQERSDVYDWKGAQYYYNALLERFPNDPELTVAATYELAFIEYKQGHYEKARAGFQAVLERYSAAGGESLPQTWKILAEKVLAKLPKPASK
ncbi:MAG: hypothetical protein LLF89_07205 [Spirochaetaceae bacterium]|nr:hypothetical protein [Spirochaetaceae bacterium]